MNENFYFSYLHRYVMGKYLSTLLKGITAPCSREMALNQLLGSSTAHWQSRVSVSERVNFYFSLSMTKKMPTTFLVMTGPKELFLFNISSALLPELGSPAGLNWCFSVSFLLIFSFSNFYEFYLLLFLWLFFPLVSLSMLTAVL